MRSAYRVLAFVVAGLVVVQAAAIAYAVFGLRKWVEGGATVTDEVMNSRDTSFDGVLGFAIHGINGSTLIPLIALILLIVSFFAKVPGGIKWAAFVLLSVVVQVALGMTAAEAPGLGALHGLNALILFGLAITAGMRAKDHAVAGYTPQTAERTTV